MYSTVACAFEGCTTLYVGKMDALESTIPRGWSLSPKGEPWCPKHGIDEWRTKMTEHNRLGKARQFLGGGAGHSGASGPNATSESHAIYKWVERNIKDVPGASVSIDPATGQMVIGNYGMNYPVSMYDWVVQGENGRFFVLGDAEFRGWSLDVFDDAAHRNRATFISEGEVRTTSSTGGEKGMKPERYSLIPVPALDIMARLYGFGAEKYAAHNWRKGYEWSKSFDSLFRHATAALNGEDIDPETGLPHLAGAAFHCFTLMVFMQEHPEFDDRWKKDSKN